MKRFIALLLTISATFAMMINTAGASSFSDVSDDAWYSDEVATVTPYYMNGYEDGTFRPENNVTRAEAAQILYNFKLPLEYGDETIFSDVPYDAWYFPAASWNGSFIGGSKSTPSNSPLGYTAYFYPNEYITREDFAVGLYNRFLASGMNISNVTSPITTYADRNQITVTDSSNKYPYERAFAVLKYYNVMNGNPDGTINPKGLLTRAEMAQIISNLATETGLLIGDPDLRL